MSCCGVVTSASYYASPTARLTVSSSCNAAAAVEDIDEELNNIASAASAAVFASFKSSTSPSSALGCQLQNASRDRHPAGTVGVSMSSAIQLAGVGMERHQSAAMEARSVGVHFERRERVLLRPWLENLIDSGKVPGLEWLDNVRSKFKVPWKHRSKKNWSMLHSCVFLEWAKNTGRWREGDAEPNYAQLKTRLRCAFNKAPDIEEMKELHSMKCDEPYKVYRFIPRRDGRTRPFARTFVTRASIPIASRKRRRRVHIQHQQQQQLVGGVLASMSDTADLKGFRPEYIGDCRQLEIGQPFSVSTQLLDRGCNEDEMVWKSEMWKCSNSKLYQTDYLRCLPTSKHNSDMEMMPVAIKTEMCDDDQYFKDGYEEIPPELTSRRILPEVDNSCDMFPPPCQLPLAPSSSSEVMRPAVIYKEAKIASSVLVERSGPVVTTSDDSEEHRLRSVKFYDDRNTRYCSADMVSKLYKDEYYKPGREAAVDDLFSKHRPVVQSQTTNSISSNNSVSLSSPLSECSVNSSNNEAINPNHATSRQVNKVDDNMSAPRLHRLKNRYLMEQRQLQEQLTTTGDSGTERVSDNCSSLLLSSPTNPRAALRGLPPIDIVDSIALLNVGMQSSRRSDSHVVFDEAASAPGRNRVTEESMSVGNLQRYEQLWHYKNRYRVRDGECDGSDKKQAVVDVEERSRGVYFDRSSMSQRVSCRETEFYTEQELQQCCNSAGVEVIYHNGEQVSYSPPPADPEAVDLSPTADAMDLSKKGTIGTASCESYYAGSGRNQSTDYVHETRDPVRDVHSSQVYYRKPTATATAKDLFEAIVDDKGKPVLFKKGSQVDEMERLFELQCREALEKQIKRVHVLPEFAPAPDLYHLSPAAATETELRGEHFVRFIEQTDYSSSSSSSCRPMIARTDKSSDTNYIGAKRTRLDDVCATTGRAQEENLVVCHGPFQIRRQTVAAEGQDGTHSSSDVLSYEHDDERQHMSLIAKGRQFSLAEYERMLGSRKRARNLVSASVTNSGKVYSSDGCWEERELKPVDRRIVDAKYELSPKQNHYVVSYVAGPDLSEQPKRAVGYKNSMPSPPEPVGIRAPASSVLCAGVGQTYANERSKSTWSTSMNGMLATVPVTVRQLVASAAGTTAASILPPLSPGVDDGRVDMSPTRGPAYSSNGSQSMVYFSRNNGPGVYRSDHVDGKVAYSDSCKRQTMHAANSGLLLPNGNALFKNDSEAVLMLPHKASHYYRQHELDKPSSQRPSSPGFRPLTLDGGRRNGQIAGSYSLRMTDAEANFGQRVYGTAEYKDARKAERDIYN